MAFPTPRVFNSEPPNVFAGDLTLLIDVCCLGGGLSNQAHPLERVAKQCDISGHENGQNGKLLDFPHLHGCSLLNHRS